MLRVAVKFAKDVDVEQLEEIKLDVIRNSKTHTFLEILVHERSMVREESREAKACAARKLKSNPTFWFLVESGRHSNIYFMCSIRLKYYSLLPME
jgi:hypothetical protein